MDFLLKILSFWWVFALLMGAIFYRSLFQLLGIIFIPEDKIGLVTKKFVLFGDDKALPDGRIIATKGEAGYQAQTLAPGVYFWMWLWQYEITLQQLTVIPNGKIGLLIAKDGSGLTSGRVLAPAVSCDSFQDTFAFLTNGGQKGRQAGYLTAGTYRINTFLFEVSLADMTRIEENRVGVITTLDGQPIEAGNIAGAQIDGHQNFQDADIFLRTGGSRGLQLQVVLDRKSVV